MQPIEFLTENLELRSYFAFFRDKSPCSGIRWIVDNGADITAGQTLGHFLFTAHVPAAIVSPIDAVLLRRYESDGAALHQRPSQLIAILAPERVRGGDDDQDMWSDLAAAFR
jgi:hypothetical protein